MKSVIVEGDVYGARHYRFQPGFLDFARHYGFQPQLCQPYHAKTKGKLSTFAEALPHLPQKAISNDAGLTEFLGSVRKAEVAARLSRQRITRARLAGFPATRTPDGFDFNAATGMPTAQISELASLTFSPVPIGQAAPRSRYARCSIGCYTTPICINSGRKLPLA